MPLQELWPSGFSCFSVLPAPGFSPDQELLPVVEQPVTMSVVPARSPAMVRPARILFSSCVSMDTSLNTFSNASSAPGRRTSKKLYHEMNWITTRTTMKRCTVFGYDFCEQQGGRYPYPSISCLFTLWFSPRWSPLPWYTGRRSSSPPNPSGWSGQGCCGIFRSENIFRFELKLPENCLQETGTDYFARMDRYSYLSRLIGMNKVLVAPL